MKMHRCCLFFLCMISFPLLAKEEWNTYKENTLAQMTFVPGWCSAEKASLMMDIIKKYRCTKCVEIGVFSGRSLFVIAKTVLYNEKGVAFGIDAWDPRESTKGFEVTSPNYEWWRSVDYALAYQNVINLITANNLQGCCKIIKSSSQTAVRHFADESIDFIHIDGNHNEEIPFQDVLTYLPKVKDGGFILINDSHSVNMRREVMFLLEKAELVSTFSPSATFLLFRKDKKRMAAARQLLVK